MTDTKKANALRSIDPRQLRSVRGGVLYPAVKLLDTTVGVLASDIYVKFGGISGEAGAVDR